MKKENSKYGMPEKVIFCKKCVISNQRPSSSVEIKSSDPYNKTGISFEKDGICSACKFHDEKQKNINWNQREEELLILLDKYRRNDGSYDVVVPGSGGKDSSFTAHILKYKYGMNPLTVTWLLTSILKLDGKISLIGCMLEAWIIYCIHQMAIYIDY